MSNRPQDQRTPGGVRRTDVVFETQADPPEDGSELGAIRVHNSVIASIARIATLKVPGVLEMSGSFAEGLASVMGKASFDGGIKVMVEEQKVNLNVYVTLAFGVRIPSVAWQIQNNVRQALEDLTGKRVGAINVIVRGIKQQEPTGAETSPTAAAPAAREGEEL